MFYSFQNGLSYCPQNSFLDPLLTVEEVIRFYGKLRNIENMDKVKIKTRRVKLVHINLTPTHCS